LIYSNISDTLYSKEESVDDTDKTREQLIAEVKTLRRRSAELERRSEEHTNRLPTPAEERYRRLFDAARDGIVLVDADTGDIMDINPSFLTMTGYNRDELMGQTIWRIDPFQDTDAIQVIFKELRNRDHIYYDDLPMDTKNGQRVPVEIVGSAHTISDRKVLQYTVRDISRRKTIEDALWKAESRFKALFQKAAIGIAIVDSGGSVIECNPALEKMLGYSEKEMTGRHFADFTHEEDRQTDASSFEELLTRKLDNYQMAVRCKRKDGAVVWALLSVSLIRNTKNEPLYAIRMVEDITDRKQAEETVIKSRQFYLSLIDELPNPIRRTDADAQSDYFNKAWQEFTGRSISQELGDAWTEGVHPEDRGRLKKIQFTSFEQRSAYVTEYRLLNRNGEYRWMVEYGRPITDIDGSFSGYISSCYDVQDRKNFEETLHSLSTTDELTGLLNRRGFFALAQQQLKVANRTGKGFLLFYVDLDGMKKINDTFGHPEGDLALVETASVLREIFRESDIISRIGGDEFAVLVLEYARDGEEERAILRRMEESIRTRNSQPGRRYSLSLSAGLSTYDPETPCSLDELISRTDSIMYEEKKSKYRSQSREA
jgi:diguanylate cyclase (GGDEF)-like protein/PAS domain S-box-containing protein